MFKKLKNIFNREGHHHRHSGGKHCHGDCCKDMREIPEGAVPLDEAPKDKKITVVANSDIKTMEMGLYPGSLVTVVHNESQERNIIVKIHDQKYVIPKEIAENIFVKTR